MKLNRRTSLLAGSSRCLAPGLLLALLVLVGPASSGSGGTKDRAPDQHRVFNPQVLEAGYQVEMVVPGGPNTPSDVAVLPDGSLYLASARSSKVYRVSMSGTLTTAASVGVYALDAGPDGNLYGYFYPGAPGTLYRITPQGQVTSVGYVPWTGCESTIAVAPNLDLWIGYNGCGGAAMDGRLYRLTQAGELFTITLGLPFGIGGLDFDASRQLYMTLENELFRVDTSDGSRRLVATLPDVAASHGLVIDPAGNFYISSYLESNINRIFKVTPGGDVSVLATLPDGCLQGLDRLPGGDLVATMRCTGAVYRVYLDGAWDTVLPGNGMATPQAMAFNLAGQLLVVNDESGGIVRVNNGRGEFFAEVNSYVMPLGFLAFEPSGDFYFSEAAPSSTPRLVRVSPQGTVTEVTRDVDEPSGLAFTPDGTLYVAEYASGEISSVSGQGQVTTFTLGLTRPQSVAADSAGNLYVAHYEEGLVEPEYWGSNLISKIDQNGLRTPLATIGVADLVFSPGGDLYVTGSVGDQSGILRVAPDGGLTPFASGFLTATGLAFDLAGDLYISDDWHNSITRITGFPQGTIQGTVADAENGQPLTGAKLSIVTDYPLVLGTELTTNAVAHYNTIVAPRSYKVTASAPGYQPSSQMITVQSGMTATVDLELTPWALSTTSTISGSTTTTVSGETSTTTSASGGETTTTTPAITTSIGRCTYGSCITTGECFIAYGIGWACINGCCENTGVDCPISFVLEGDEAQLDAIRAFRDNVLSQTPAGQELIKLYYQLSPVIVKIMEEDEKFKQWVKEMIEEILPLIEEGVK